MKDNIKTNRKQAAHFLSPTVGHLSVHPNTTSNLIHTTSAGGKHTPNIRMVYAVFTHPITQCFMNIKEDEEP